MASKNPIAVAAEYITLAITLPASTFVGYLIGYLLDKWLGTTWLSMLFLVLGTAGGLLQIIRKFQKDAGKNGT
jgi:F0F1-type ATP synthase assembly protein I